MPFGMSFTPSWQTVRTLSGGKQGDVTLVQRFAPEFQKGVLKRVAAAQAQDERSFERLKREIGILREIKHPCIIGILDSELDGADPWIVTEWAALGSLQDHVAVFKGDVLRTLRLARDVASGLGYSPEGTPRLVRTSKRGRTISWSALGAAILMRLMSFSPE